MRMIRRIRTDDKGVATIEMAFALPVLIIMIWAIVQLGMMFRDLDKARERGDAVEAKRIEHAIDNYETHVVPIIADIDAGFGNAEATYLLAKKMIEAGACALQIENQVSDEKQCGHQDGKVTVPHEDFIAKIRAIRYAFMEMGVEDGIIVARTDSLGAGLTKQIAVTREAGPVKGGTTIIAFVTDPDGYKIELIQRTEST